MPDLLVDGDETIAICTRHRHDLAKLTLRRRFSMPKVKDCARYKERLIITSGTSINLNADEIEQRIIRAYVKLACTHQETNESRVVTVARFGALEVRLTESLTLLQPTNWPLFWLEVYSNASGSIIDSCGFSEFDDDELAVAVELITSAVLETQALH